MTEAEHVKDFLDDYFNDEEEHSETEKRGRSPDCYLLMRTKLGQIVGPPVAIYGSKEGAYRGFPQSVKPVDEMFGIVFISWWFDDVATSR